MQDGSRLLPHSVHGLLSPSLLSPTGTISALTYFYSVHLLFSYYTSLLFFSAFLVLALLSTCSCFVLLLLLLWSYCCNQSLTLCIRDASLCPDICSFFTLHLIRTRLNLKKCELWNLWDFWWKNSQAHNMHLQIASCLMIFSLSSFLIWKPCKGVLCFITFSYACFFPLLPFLLATFAKSAHIDFFSSCPSLATTASQTEVKLLDFCALLFFTLSYTRLRFSPSAHFLFSPFLRRVLYRSLTAQLFVFALTADLWLFFPLWTHLYMRSF